MIRLFRKRIKRLKSLRIPDFPQLIPDLDSPSDPDPEQGSGRLFQEATHGIYLTNDHLQV